MHEPEFEHADLVEKLIDPQISAERLWDEHELREILLHQLDGPIVADMVLLGNVQALEAAGLSEQAVPQIRTYRQLFEHPAPPARLLMLVKSFAQAQLTATEPNLPGRVARLLYFTSLAAAQTRYGQPISSLPPADLLAGVNWLLAEPWVDDHSRALLRQLLPAGSTQGEAGTAG